MRIALRCVDRPGGDELAWDGFPGALQLRHAYHAYKLLVALSNGDS